MADPAGFEADDEETALLLRSTTSRAPGSVRSGLLLTMSTTTSPRSPWGRTTRPT